MHGKNVVIHLESQMSWSWAILPERGRTLVRYRYVQRISSTPPRPKFNLSTGGVCIASPVYTGSQTQKPQAILFVHIFNPKILRVITSTHTRRWTYRCRWSYLYGRCLGEPDVSQNTLSGANFRSRESTYFPHVKPTSFRNSPENWPSVNMDNRCVATRKHGIQIPWT